MFDWGVLKMESQKRYGFALAMGGAFVVHWINYIL